VPQTENFTLKIFHDLERVKRGTYVFLGFNRLSRTGINATILSA